ncbi:cobyrinic acid a,c-diamide synthase [Cupriavidus sp. USMAA2-4]|uniref:cobyrinate a,c-diamide synthase n=1 Tax=Cupriavidus sp. USMAA2-4 TaxID=876364 RepID=UPI0008A6782C|nr:cobyrinate a,c-diamide synthase [Cupriavidus sp. USMAA2-4]AOY94795.1 cobyrinic acid a,c-diamide synthase [Cupriavidus sp. USMAA2-4]
MPRPASAPPATLRAPALLVAAPASGQGKTTVTAALARLHRRQGLRVRVFKAGPDFLDPSLLAYASGAPVHSLDLWMTGADDAAARLAEAARDADLLLVEGVMGLHDGEPSSADLARRFGLPVLGVIQAGAMAQTFGAIALGLANYGGALPGMQVLANGVASARHAQMLQASVPAGIGWAGTLPREARASLPERHLGLLAADELPDLGERLDALADLLATQPVAQLPAPVAFADVAAIPPPPLLAGKTVAVARDAAFRFLYPANLELLAAMGARLAFFSPLADARLPACDALWLPGGYPELHAAQLAANRGMLDALRDAHGAGLPMLAECGGMMALFDTLVDKEGLSHAMAGLLPGTVRMQRRLSALGPQAVALPEGTLRGHTFHYSQADSPLVAATHATSPRDGARGEAIYRCGSLTASYVHFYFPSDPHAVAALLGAGAPAPGSGY